MINFGKLTTTKKHKRLGHLKTGKKLQSHRNSNLRSTQEYFVSNFKVDKWKNKTAGNKGYPVNMHIAGGHFNPGTIETLGSVQFQFNENCWTFLRNIISNAFYFM